MFPLLQFTTLFASIIDRIVFKIFSRNVDAYRIITPLNNTVMVSPLKYTCFPIFSLEYPLRYNICVIRRCVLIKKREVPKHQNVKNLVFMIIFLELSFDIFYVFRVITIFFNHNMIYTSILVFKDS